MTLLLVLHDLAPKDPAAKPFFEAIFEIAAEHWPVTPSAVLVAAEVSPAYLRDHLLRATGGHTGLLLVLRCRDQPAWSGLPAEGEAWLREVSG